MNIDWKEVCRSPGYKSLKAAYVDDLQESAKRKRDGLLGGRSKSQLRNSFKWVIGRAMHYAHAQNKTLAVVLGEWEEKRTYWWLNFYQDYNLPKIKSP